MVLVFDSFSCCLSVSRSVQTPVEVRSCKICLGDFRLDEGILEKEGEPDNLIERKQEEIGQKKEKMRRTRENERKRHRTK